MADSQAQPGAQPAPAVPARPAPADDDSQAVQVIPAAAAPAGDKPAVDSGDKSRELDADALRKQLKEKLS
jgi:hypothetical protein